MKTCSKCLAEKAESDFYSIKRTGKLRSSCKSCYNLAAKKHYAENIDDYKERNASHYQNNKEYYAKKDRRWREENRERSSQITLEYFKRNPHVSAQMSAKRRAKIRNQTPELTAEQKNYIDYLYWLAKDLRAVSGEDYHVDHIHPLSKGGLHEPSNLQILPKDLNLRKSDKVDF